MSQSYPLVPARLSGRHSRRLAQIRAALRGTLYFDSGTFQTLDSMKDRVEDIPCVIGGKEIFSGNIQKQVAVRLCREGEREREEREGGGGGEGERETACFCVCRYVALVHAMCLKACM